jgi:Ca2+-binding EF-hand superfamily protein
MRIALAASCLLLAGAAPPPVPPIPPPPPKLFVSPVGEPFRASGPADDPVSHWFGQADSDRNGALSRAEMEADAARFFATLDRNHDGEIDPDELSRYEREVAPEIQLGGQMAPLSFGRQEKRKKKDSDDGLQGAGRYAWLNIPEPGAAADADLNRGVSRDELVRAAGERFDRLDADHDGALTRAELPPLPEQRSEEEKKQARKKPKRSEGIPIPLD